MLKLGSSFVVFALLSSTAFAVGGPRLPWPGQENYQAAPAPAPAPGTPAAAPSPAIPGQPQAAPAPRQLNLPQQDPASQLLQQMLGGSNGKKGFWGNDSESGSDLAAGLKSSYGYKNQAATDGKMERCATPPPRVLSAIAEAKAFRNACSEAQLGDKQRIVINDYSSKGRDDIPYMYIFDLDGNCLGKTAVTYGNGLGPVVPEPCSDNGRHLTPPGFHLTTSHDSSSYPAGSSLGMVSLEGQNSGARGILIHPAARPGTASSFGCSGVGSFDTVKKTLGKGALVYNFFGNKDRADGCHSSAGLKHNGKSCHVESQQPELPSTATGQGTPAMK